MAYQASEIISMAQYRNVRNKTDLISNADAVDILDREQRRMYLLAVGDNPDYFGTSTTLTRTASTDPFGLPTRVIGVSKLVVAGITGTPTPAVGDEVYLVSFRAPELMPVPRVYMRNKQLYDVGTDLGSGSDYVDDLTCYYNAFPTAMADEDAYISIPDEHIDPLVLRLAAMFALRDGGRENEYGALMAEYADALQLFREATKILEFGATRPETHISVWQPGGAPNAES
jgi:hypothetical protein